MSDVRFDAETGIALGEGVDCHPFDRAQGRRRRAFLAMTGLGRRWLFEILNLVQHDGVVS